MTQSSFTVWGWMLLSGFLLSGLFGCTEDSPITKAIEDQKKCAIQQACDDQKDPEPEDQVSGPPEVRHIDQLPDGFNRPGQTIAPIKIEEGKIFWAQQVSVYRSIWFDALAEVTIHQPLLMPIVMAGNILQFKYIGFTYHLDYDQPEFSTTILALNGRDPQAFAVPTGFELVFERQQGLDFNEIYQKCYGVEGELVPEWINKCRFLVKSTTEDGRMKAEEFLRRRNIAVWRPIPPEGYKCLGYLVTNSGTGSPNEPILNIDQTGIYSYRHGIEYAPTFCVSEQYLAPGKPGRKHRLPYHYDDGSYGVFFLVEPESADTGFSSNLFMVVRVNNPAQEQARLDAVETWVLKASVVQEISQSALSESP